MTGFACRNAVLLGWTVRREACEASLASEIAIVFVV